MITQAESGLTADQYNYLKTLVTDYTYKVVAHRYNLDFGDTPYFVGEGDAVGVDFDVILKDDYLFRLSGSDLLERLDLNTGTWQTMTNYTAPTDPAPGCRCTLAVNGTELYVYAATATGIQQRISSSDGATWFSWSTIYSYSDVQFYSGNCFWNGYNGVASASTTYSTFSASKAMDGSENGLNYWRTATGTTTGWLQFKYNTPEQAVNIEKYSINGDVKSWTFEGSANGSSWTTLHTVTNDTGGSWRSYTFTNATAYQYYRWNITAVNTYTFIFVLEVFAYEKTEEQQVNFLKATAWNTVHFIQESSSSYWSELKTLFWNGSSWVTSVGPMLSFQARSFEAVALTVNGQAWEALLVDTETPGRPLETLVGTTLTTQMEAEGGILAFLYQPDGRQYSDHVWVDKVAPMDLYNYRSRLKASVMNGKVYLTCFHSTGDAFNAIPSYRVYISQDLVNWSAPKQIPLPSDLESGLHLVQVGQYCYGFEKRDVWRSDSTLFVGSSAAAVQEDISIYVHDYKTTQSGAFQAQFALDNSDGHFTDHAFINDQHLVALEHFLGGWEGSTQRLYRVGITQIDSFQDTDDKAAYYINCAARDHFSWMSDDTAAEQVLIKDGWNVGLDSFSDQSGTNYGGLSHFATVSGEWQTIANELIATPGENANRLCVGYSTFNPDIWNGVIQVAMKLNSSGVIHGGIAFRLKNNNFHYVYYSKSDDSLIFSISGWDASGGGILSTATSIGWSGTIASQFKYLRVRLYYNAIKAYTSSDGITWTEKIAYFTTHPYKERPSIPRPKPVGLASRIEKGYAGLYANIQASAGAQATFSNFQVMDTERPLSVEDAFKTFTAFANIHDTEFGEFFTRGGAGWTLGSGMSLSDPNAADAYYDQSFYDGGDVYGP